MKILLKTALATALLGASVSAHALSVTGVTNANGASTLIPALLGPTSGINVVGGSGTYVGADDQGGTYADFNTVPPENGTLGDGIVLSSGYASLVPNTNTDSSWDHNELPPPNNVAPESVAGGSTDDAELSDILTKAGAPSSDVNDVNTLEFEFTLDDPTQNAVTANFVWGTEEFPDQGVTDLFAFIVDGVNFAAFPDGSLINFDLGSPSAAFYNANEGGAFGIEWDGITDVLTVTGLLDMSLTTHTIKIAASDTSDTVFDSAVYIEGLSGTQAKDGGITPPDGGVPVPAPVFLIGAALLGLGFSRRRRS